ncbi:hypothetical protein F4811DRAFT_545887 [Daldinia bambusicola]|nr:hypothetical protein F4811DRAFT_545887 [Daldinia bambusicola]
MCHKWSLKIMACGHIDSDNQILHCGNYSPLYNNCPVREHGVDTVRQYTEGDGKCRKCLGREELTERYRRFQGTEFDQSARARLDMTREFVFSFETLETPDLCEIQDQLIFEYIRSGDVLNVIPMLQALNCDIPGLITQEELENSSAWAEGISFTPMAEYEVPMFNQTDPQQWGEALQEGHVAPTPTWEIMTQSPEIKKAPPPTPVPLSEQQDISYNGDDYPTPSSSVLERWASELPIDGMGDMGDTEGFSDEIGGKQESS